MRHPPQQVESVAVESIALLRGDRVWADKWRLGILSQFGQFYFNAGGIAADQCEYVVFP